MVNYKRCTYNIIVLMIMCLFRNADHGDVIADGVTAGAFNRKSSVVDDRF